MIIDYYLMVFNKHVGKLSQPTLAIPVNNNKDIL